MKIHQLWLCALILALLVSLYNAEKCKHTDKCQCVQENIEEIEYWCFGGSDQQLIIEVFFDRAIRIICDNVTDFGTSTLPYLKDIKTTQRFSRLTLKQCPVPDISIYTLLQFLGIKSIKDFVFESYLEIGDGFKPFHFENLTFLETVILWNNQITELPETLFKDVPKLKKLFLNNNALIKLPSELFKPTPNLEKLEIGSNNFTTWNEDEFKYVPNLSFLNSYKNNLKIARRRIFSRVPKLQNLDLGSNNLIKLEDGVFDDLEQLQYLNLNYNDLRYLPKDLFVRNRKLEIVNFFFALNSDLTTLPSGLLANLTHLNRTFITCNNLKYLPENLFENCYNLEHLMLTNNSLRTLPGLIFKDTVKLKVLDISDNELEFLNETLFSNLKYLTTLNLHQNRLTYISSNVLPNLKFLTELDLSRNLITDFGNNAFSGIPQVRKISLHSNQLALDRFKELKYSPFKECRALTDLNLKNNSINTLFEDWRYTLTKLKRLDLSYNNFTSIISEDLIFTSGNFPVEVDLSYNQIDTVSIQDLEDRIKNQCDPPPCNEKSFFNRSMTILSMNGNPILCDCGAFPIANYLQGNLFHLVYKLIKINSDDVVCHSPESVKNISLREVDLKKLVCPIEQVEPFRMKKICPFNCSCTFRPVDKTIVVNCNKMGLTKFPEVIPVWPDTNVELLFADNNLNNLNGLSKLLKANVTKLSLSYNKITDVNELELPKALKILELDNNEISSLSKRMIVQLNASTTLNTISLFKNPWHCNCDTKDLSNFLRSQVTYKQILNYHNITCKENGQSVMNLSVDDLCRVSLTIIVTCICLAVFGLLSGATIALYYIYEHEIKVWMFAHKICLWLVAEKEIDKNKIYDAFVSFSTKDQAFVVGQLMPQLEQSGEHRYKLCIHFRDFVVGEWIPNQIINSVENSRRTIIVLSPDFLESVWARMEFRTAHLKAIQERCARVIVILLSDINMEKLDPELKAYITMNTYVKWGDPLFWEKLRYALPHPQMYLKKKCNVAPYSESELKKQQKMLNLDEIYKAKI